MTDSREILRRLQGGEPDRRIARDLGVSRNTVGRSRVWARRHGVLAGEPRPDPAALAARLEPGRGDRPAHAPSWVAPFRERVQALHDRGVEGQAIWQILVEEHGFAGSDSSVPRCLRRLTPPEVRATIRLGGDPGEEAQVAFGFGGQFRDPERGQVRRAGVVVMTLSCSRHPYAELGFDPTVDTWLRLHRAAFEVFGGVLRRVVLDNLRAAIVRAALYDPEVQRRYREFAEHSRFLIAPCRPLTPEHKEQGEPGGVPYGQRHALAGRAGRDVQEANRHLWRWCVEIAGRRVHGPTKRIPLELCDQVARPALGPRPPPPWELVAWKRATRHADCHVGFAGAYDSAPHRLLGQRLWVRATAWKVELFHAYALVATPRHARPWTTFFPDPGTEDGRSATWNCPIRSRPCSAPCACRASSRPWRSATARPSSRRRRAGRSSPPACTTRSSGARRRSSACGCGAPPSTPPRRSRGSTSASTPRSTGPRSSTSRRAPSSSVMRTSGSTARPGSGRATWRRHSPIKLPPRL